MTEPKRKGRPKKPPTQEFQVNKQVRRIAPRLSPATAELVSPKNLDKLAQQAQIRQVAGIDYITDPDMRPVEYHHARTDRPWRNAIDLNTMKRWALDDHWNERRRDYWQQVQARIVDARQHEMVKRRLSEISEFEETRDALMQYLRPLKDKHGRILRHPTHDKKGQEHPLAGLAIFPVEMPKLDRLAKALIDLDRHVMTKRGEIPEEAETGAPESKKPILALSGQEDFTPGERRAMAEALIKMRSGADEDGSEDEDGDTA